MFHQLLDMPFAGFGIHTQDTGCGAGSCADVSAGVSRMTPLYGMPNRTGRPGLHGRASRRRGSDGGAFPGSRSSIGTGLRPASAPQPTCDSHSEPVTPAGCGEGRCSSRGVDGNPRVTSAATNFVRLRPPEGEKWCNPLLSDEAMKSRSVLKGPRTDAPALSSLVWPDSSTASRREQERGDGRFAAVTGRDFLRPLGDVLGAGCRWRGRVAVSSRQAARSYSSMRAPRRSRRWMVPTPLTMAAWRGGIRSRLRWGRARL